MIVFELVEGYASILEWEYLLTPFNYEINHNSPTKHYESWDVEDYLSWNAQQLNNVKCETFVIPSPASMQTKFYRVCNSVTGETLHYVHYLLNSNSLREIRPTILSKKVLG